MHNKVNLEINDIVTQLEHLDYNYLVNILSPIVTYSATFFVAHKAVKSYELHKNFKPKNIQSISIVPEIIQEYSSVDINALAAQNFGKAVSKFAKVIIKKFPANDLTIFYNNINELTVKHKNFALSDAEADYIIKKKIIRVDGKNYLSAIYHELFHMSSSIFKDGVCYSGFQQSSFKNGGINIGEAINEGYTQLLAERYFGKDDDDDENEFEVDTAKQLEKIIGKEKMTSLYLNANLLGLINELKNYASEEEISNFISGTDFLFKHLDEKNILPFEKRLVLKSLKNVKEFLVKAYTVKLKIQLERGKINANEMSKKLALYIVSLGSSIKPRKYKYEFLSPTDLQDIISNVMGKKVEVKAESKEIKGLSSKGR